MGFNPLGSTTPPRSETTRTPASRGGRNAASEASSVRPQPTPTVIPSPIRSDRKRPSAAPTSRAVSSGEPSPGTTMARSSEKRASSAVARSVRSPGGMSIQIWTSARRRASSSRRMTLERLMPSRSAISFCVMSRL